MRLDKRFRRAALLLAVACLLAALGASTSGASAAEPGCTVGKPPTLENGPEVLEKPASPELVIACGHGVTGPYEIAAYTDAHHTLCTIFLGEGFGGGQCGAAFRESQLNRDSFLTTSMNWAWGAGPGPSSTSITGWALPDVARIEVRYHHDNAKPIHHANAILGQVGGQLLTTLGQTEPFGRFAIVLPGCSLPQGIRILAFNPEGTLLGSEQGHKPGFAPPCHGNDGSFDAGGGT
jgi:hypothetical protein